MEKSVVAARALATLHVPTEALSLDVIRAQAPITAVPPVAEGSPPRWFQGQKLGTTVDQVDMPAVAPADVIAVLPLKLGIPGGAPLPELYSIIASWLQD